jgi:peptidyl-prolyl cis-trans isomerase C
MIRTLSFLLVFAALGAPGCKKQPSTLATIDGKKVTQAEFDAYLKLKHVAPADSARRERALEEFLEREALAAVIAKEPGLDKAAIEAELAEQRRETLINRYFERVLDQKVTEEAVKSYFDAHAKDYEQKKIHVAHILFRTNTKMSAAEKQARLTSAQAAAAKIAAGQDFAEVARNESEDRISGASGGDLGWLREGAIDPEFSKRVFGMKEGAVSEPFETSFGYHVVKVLEEAKVVRKPYGAAVGDIRYQLRAEAKEAELERLKGKAQVTRKQPYQLSSASSASPIASAARPSPAPPPAGDRGPATVTVSSKPVLGAPKPPASTR